MKPKHQRLVFVALSLAMLTAAALLTLNAFRANLVFFVTPSEIRENSAVSAGRTLRLGGLVQMGSVSYGYDGTVSFALSDGAAFVDVTYKGTLPQLFREGQGAVVEGTLAEAGPGQPPVFIARRVLTKHDENYMPKEVVDALKKSGRWKETGAKIP